jgi:hypothetical protein
MAASTFAVEHEDRLQFFQLTDGRFALTAVRPSRDTRSVDRDGRRAFLCFGWVLEGEELSKLGNHPFAVFPAVEELHDVPALLEELGNPGSLIEPVDLAKRPLETLQPGLPTDTLDLLIMAAFRTGRGATVDRPVHLLGLPRHCATLLSWTLSHIPPSARVRCTFSTQTDQCSIPSGRFWAVGRTSREGQRSAFEVAMPSGAVRGDTTPLRKASDARRYLRWLESHKKMRGKPSDEQLTDVELVLRAIDGEGDVHAGQVRNLDFVADLIRFYVEDVREKLVRRLAPILSPKAARTAAEALSGMPGPDVVGTLLDLLAQGSGALERSKLRAVLEPGWAELRSIQRWYSKVKFLSRTITPRNTGKR